MRACFGALVDFIDCVPCVCACVCVRACVRACVRLFGAPPFMYVCVYGCADGLTDCLPGHLQHLWRVRLHPERVLPQGDRGFAQDYLPRHRCVSRFADRPSVRPVGQFRTDCLTASPTHQCGVLPKLRYYCNAGCCAALRCAALRACVCRVFSPTNHAARRCGFFGHRCCCCCRAPIITSPSRTHG